MSNTPTERFLGALYLATGKKAKPSGNGWQARCPGHEDRNPSLSVSEGDDGRVLVRCHAGCTPEAIVAAVGLMMADLMPEGGIDHLRAVKGGAVSALAARKLAPSTFPTARAAIAELEGRHGPKSAIWTYHNVGNEPVGVIVRWERSDGSKDIRPVSRNGEGWIIGGMPAPRPLYRLPNLATAEIVYVFEGEKAAEAARSIGLTATTSPHGSKSAKKADWSPLAGRQAVILPDNDPAGQSYAEAVTAILASLTPPAVVRVVDLPGLPENGDIVDWIDGHGDAAEPEELRRQVEALADAAPVIDSMLSRQNRAPVLVRLSDVQSVPIRWLWPGRVALGKLTLLAGDPGLGKSVVTLDVAARVSTGAPWPDDPDSAAPTGGVVLLSAEDDLGDTIRPRLDAAGADVSQIVALTAVRGQDEAGEYGRPVDLSRDLDQIEAAIEQSTGCRMVVIDPITAYVGHTDAHKNAEIRALLAPLAALAGRRRVAVVAVTHLRKSGGPAVYRSMGSLAFAAAARAVWAVAKDQQDPERRLLLPVKNNLAADTLGLAFRVEPHPELRMPVVAWEPDPVTISADEALADERTKEGSALDEAVDWLRDGLTDGPLKAKDVKARARADGISPRTLDRAKARLKVVTGPDGFRGPWVWRLPDTSTVRQDSTECANPETLAHSAKSGALCDDDWGEA